MHKGEHVVNLFASLSSLLRKPPFPALIACVLEQLYVQRCIAAQHQRQMHVVFKTLPQKFTKLVFIPPETEAFVKNPALETWEIYTHTPGLAVPSQDKVDALLDGWGFVEEEL